MRKGGKGNKNIEGSCYYNSINNSEICF